MKKTIVSITMLVLVLLSFLPSACNSGNPTTTGAPQGSGGTTPVATSADPLVPPKPAQLDAEHYAFPDFPRITAEKLHGMIADANDSGRIFEPGTYVVYWDFTIVDVKNPIDFKKKGRIAGAWNFPFSYYWVLDPREDPKAEEMQAYRDELTALNANLPTLPKDKITIFYDDTADDRAACMVAQMLLDLKIGYDPAKIFVLNGGFYKYTLDPHPAYTYKGIEYLAAPGGYGWVFGDAEDFE
jgi:hypothetical protein